MKDPVIDTAIRLAKLTRSRVPMCCPWHLETTPSFFIDGVNETYHCFGCGKSGSIWDFGLPDAEGPSDIEAS
jgi:DNA primase